MHHRPAGGFGQNIDSHCLAAGGGMVVFGTEEGRGFVSNDGGESWREVLGGNAGVTCVVSTASERPGT
jgi:hypothetical protein